jgi:HD-like signal output (HDOD) protein
MRKIAIPDSFPNLPSAIRKIQTMFALNEINVLALVNLLQEEPLLSANILRLVNSSHYGLKNRVASINQAVTLLGSTIIRGIVMATVLKKSFPFDLSPYKITAERFDVICVLRVRLLNEWLVGENIDVKALSSAVFLMESGKIVSSQEILKNGMFETFIDLVDKGTVLEAERSLFEADSYQIASELFRQWQFEDSFTNLIQGVSNPTTREQKILLVASKAIGIEGVVSEESVAEAQESLKLYEMDASPFDKAVEVIRTELRSKA